MSARIGIALALCVVGLAACESPPRLHGTSAPASAAPAPSTDTRLVPHLRFTPAGEGELSALVRTFADAARAEGRLPLVYVGATWCEPCQYFHRAAEQGDLDGELPALALLELDLDRDRDRLAAAGYASEMIPLFAVPGPDGRGTTQRIEGSIHGPGSPLQIAPRLRALLSPTP